ncbi:MAG: DUF5131 family protein [Planctomycetota bacterium]
MTGIEWTDQVWNPTRGCSRVSEGCRNCYAERQAIRMSGPGGPYEGLVKSTPKGPRWTGDVVFDEDRLAEPARWRKPRRVFVNSMGDLFHPQLSEVDIARVLNVIGANKRHDFQVLTKLGPRMRRFFELGPHRKTWFSNLWLGVSVEHNREMVRTVHLKKVRSAAVRFLSVEPLLERVVLGGVLDWIDWVIVGGESGPKARKCDVAWIRSIVRECKDAGVPVFVKQLGASVCAPNDTLEGWPGLDYGELGVRYEGAEARQGAPVRLDLRHSKGGDPDEWPDDLRVREMPTPRTWEELAS